jgi:hypothetical protein
MRNAKTGFVKDDIAGNDDLPSIIVKGAKSFRLLIITQKNHLSQFWLHNQRDEDGKYLVYGQCIVLRVRCTSRYSICVGTRILIFFAFNPKIVPKLRNLRFGNSKIRETD